LRTGTARDGFINVWLRLVVRFTLCNRRRGRCGRGTTAVLRERLAREQKFVFAARLLCSWRPRGAFGAAIVVARTATIAAIVEAAISLTSAIVTIVVAARIATARVVASLIALRRSVFRRRKIASTRGGGLTAATTAPATTTASETAASAITAAIATPVIAAIALRATEALAAAIVARATIVALRILLRRVVVRSEILWRRCVRFRLALLEFVVRFEIAVWVTRLGAQLVAGLDDVADVVVLMVVAMFFAVRLGTSIGVSFVVLLPIMLLVGMFFVLVGFGTLALVALTNRFARQSFGTRGRGLLRRRRAVGITLPMAVIVVFEIFENVADVQEGIAVEADIDEGGLHTGEDASDAAFVDAADQRELFFALDINFD
jgi:hypothetical protein